MTAMRLSMKSSDVSVTEVKKLFDEISLTIPVGFASHESQVRRRVSEPLWERFRTLTEKVHDLEGRARLQLGTLGGGNHFIELCIDEADQLWIMLHSGSRNIGKCIAEVHIKIAKALEHNVGLVDSDLAHFLASTNEFHSYMNDLHWAQTYAAFNRHVMALLCETAARKVFTNRVHVEQTVMCHHNYVSYEHHFGEGLYVTRKGAIKADVGGLGIIPGSMGQKSYIVEGLGNAESLLSASHGAGRVHSRTKAKKLFTTEDLERVTEGVICKKDESVLDEIPMAYKDLDVVMKNQEDLVRIVHTLKAIMTVKG